MFPPAPAATPLPGLAECPHSAAHPGWSHFLGPDHCTAFTNRPSWGLCRSAVPLGLSTRCPQPCSESANCGVCSSPDFTYQPAGFMQSETSAQCDMLLKAKLARSPAALRLSGAWIVGGRTPLSPLWSDPRGAGALLGTGRPLAHRPLYLNPARGYYDQTLRGPSWHRLISSLR